MSVAAWKPRQAPRIGTRSRPSSATPRTRFPHRDSGSALADTRQARNFRTSRQGASMFTWIRRFLRLNSTALGLLLTIMVGLLCWFDTLHSFELWVSDFRFKVRGALLPGSEVVIAAIDEKSLKELGRWPWPY